MSTDDAMYSCTELEAVRRAIAPLAPPPPELFGAETPPVPLRVFWKLLDLDPPLFRRLSRDPWVQALSHYAFFPEVYRRRRPGGEIPALEVTGRTRGPVAIIRFPDITLVIKPLQNSREDRIAGTAGELDAGPLQRPSLPGYLTEDLAMGTLFTELPPERRSYEMMEVVGRSLGGIFRRLHDAGIYYNDASVADPEGRSHLYVDETGRCTLVDFGVSLLLDRHPDLSLEEVHNFVRTLPMYRVFAGMAGSRVEMTSFLEEYRGRLARVSKEEIMARDLQFVAQGLSLAARRIGGENAEAVRDGFWAGYRP